MNHYKDKVYISYAHDSGKHVDWVLTLASRLRSEGVDIILDKWDLKIGDKIQTKRKDWINKSSAVLVVLSQLYIEALDEPEDGLAFEFGLIKACLQEGRRSPRIIPLTYGADREKYTLPYVFDGLYIPDFSFDEEEKYQLLLNTLLDRSSAPDLGRPASKSKESVKAHDETAPIHLEHLQVEGFRGFPFLSLPFPHQEKESLGQWVLFLGDNGVGKSSLLWAIALALAGEKQKHGILAGLPSFVVREGYEKANVKVGTNILDFFCSIQQVQRQEKLSAASRYTDLPLFAYGTGRGSALGGANRAVELDRPLDSIGTLFGLSFNLIHAETWLKELELKSLKSMRDEDEGIFSSVVETLLQLLPGVDKLEITTEDVMVYGPSVGECSFASLSDGYLTTIGWVLDLMARWTHEAQRKGIRVKPGFNKTMTGLVLIDELDLHLHPRWQAHIIDDLRSAFPKMSFVATTHSPMTLHGAKPGELFVVRRSGDEYEVTQEDIPQGIRADQILTGVWFDLPSTLDRKTRELLDKHRSMLRKGIEQSDPKRKALERQLRLRLGSFADTSEDRMALEIAARHMTEETGEFKSLSPDEKKSVKNKIAQALTEKNGK